MKKRPFIFPSLIFGAVLFNWVLTSHYKDFHFRWDQPSLKPFEGNEFVEVSETLGVKLFQGLIADEEFKKESKWLFPIVTTVAVADLNKDGYQDLIFSNLDKETGIQIFINEKGKSFTNNKSLQGNLNKKPMSTTTLAVLDLNHDGYDDLVVGGIGCLKFFINEANKGFIDKSETYLNEPLCGIASHIALLDFDGDGDTDIILSHLYGLDHGLELKVSRKKRRSGAQNYLLKREGDTFQVVKDSPLGIAEKWTWLTGLTDYNKDGYPEAIVVNDIDTNQFFSNRSGIYEETTTKSLPKQFAANNMSAEFGDIDNDGDSELFISNSAYIKYFPYDENFLYKMNGKTGKLRQIARQRGVDKCGWAWGAKFFDFDNNGLLNLFVTNGYFLSGEKEFMYRLAYYGNGSPRIIKFARDYPRPEGHNIGGDEKSCFFYNTGDGFINLSESFDGLDGYVGRGVATIDIENDGRLDIVVSVNNGSPKVYANRTKPAPWIGFKLESKKNVFGARVELELENKKILVRELFPTNGFSSQSESRLHFGLGDYKIKKISVFWPGRKSEEVRNYNVNEYNKLFE